MLPISGLQRSRGAAPGVDSLGTRPFARGGSRIGSMGSEIMEYLGQLVDLFYSEQFCFYRNVAAVVGSLYVVRLVWSQLWQLSGGFCAFFLAPWGISRINLKKYGPWAVVTGASEGIGRGYALELARQGLNVVIMSRSQDKLQRVGDEIKEKYGREVQIIPVDFSGSFEIYPQIAENLQDLDIGVLVNNVGYSQENPDLFAEVPEERHYKVVQVNCHPVVQMTRMLLPKMVDKGRGIIINITSFLADIPVPMICNYSATKRFDSHFSDALHKEYSSKGIIVQDVKPFLVATAMTKIQTFSRLIPSPITYARAAVATIGIQHTTNGYFYHALQAFVVHLIPKWLLNGVMRIAMMAHEAKKKAKQN